MAINCLDPIFLEKEVRRFKLKVGVFLFLLQRDEILLLRRYNTGIADGCYVVPMGGLLEGETITQALMREAHEETGIRLQPADISVCHVMHRFHRTPEGFTFPQIDIYFKADRWEGSIINREPHKCDELKFYPLQALPNKTEAFIIHALSCVQQGKFFSEFGWESYGI